ncbi:putative Ig domain-containing protein [Tautonia marina]|uniref:putative Ig domain-containing protein n=1 Tax=Tautonia marina TaxID=2653855 RepID=UPI0013763D54|nr:putative Ig domain-containing protein [Tautonia marina]
MTSIRQFPGTWAPLAQRRRQDRPRRKPIAGTLEFLEARELLAVSLVTVGGTFDDLEFRAREGIRTVDRDQISLTDQSFPIEVDHAFDVDRTIFPTGDARGMLMGTTTFDPGGGLAELDLTLGVSGAGLDAPGIVESVANGSFGVVLDVSESVEVRIVTDIDAPLGSSYNRGIITFGGPYPPDGLDGLPPVFFTASSIARVPDRDETLVLDEPGIYQLTLQVQTDVRFSLPQSATSRVTLTINPTQAPELDPIGGQAVDVDETLEFFATATGAPGSTLTYSLGTDAVAGMAIDPNTGLFQWSPSVAGTFPVTVVVTDNEGLTDSETITITVDDPRAFHWTNDAGGSFDEPANWDRNAVPGILDVAYFQVPAAYTVQVGDRLVERVVLGGEPSSPVPTGIVTFVESLLRAQSTDETKPGVVVDNGWFVLQDGSVSSNFATIGLGAASEATLTGETSIFQVDGLLVVGGGGEAELNVEEKAFVNAKQILIGNATNGAPGTMNVKGPETVVELAFLTVGRTSDGTLTIEDGARVEIDASHFPDLDANDFLSTRFAIGEEGSRGVVIVRGVDVATRTPSTLTWVGGGIGGIGVSNNPAARGELRIEDGGSVVLTELLGVGVGAGTGAIVVRGLYDPDPAIFDDELRSTLEVNDLGPFGLGEGRLNFGAGGGPASLLVEDFGHVSSLRSQVGAEGGQVATAVLRSGGEWEVEEELSVGGVVGTTITIEELSILRLGDADASALDDDADILKEILKVGAPAARGSFGGRIHVNGGGLFSGPHEIQVGEEGNGEILIENGGSLDGAFRLIIGDLTEGANMGRVIVQGGRQIGSTFVSSEIEMDDPDEFSFIEVQDGGELRVQRGGSVFSETVNVTGREGEPATPLLVIDRIGPSEQNTQVVAPTVYVGKLNFFGLEGEGTGRIVLRNGGILAVQPPNFQPGLSLLDVSDNGVLDFRGGAVIVGQGQELTLGRLRITSQGNLKGDGTLIGPDPTVEGSGVNNFAGTVSPGNSPGVLTIQGNYTQGPEGTLEIEVAGPGAGTQYDQLVVTGNAVIDGTLRLVFLDGYVPQDGESFTFLVSEGIQGAFREVSVEGLAPGQAASVEIGPEGGLMVRVDGDGTPTATVVNLQRYGFHAQPTLLVLSFDQALDAASAENRSAYRLIHPGRDGQAQTADDRVIPIRDARYDPANRTVTLQTMTLLPLHARHVLVVDGGPAGVRDTTGNLLDGDGDGQGGGDHVVAFGREILAGANRSGRMVPLPRFQRTLPTLRANAPSPPRPSPALAAWLARRATPADASPTMRSALLQASQRPTRARPAWSDWIARSGQTPLPADPRSLGLALRAWLRHGR